LAYRSKGRSGGTLFDGPDKPIRENGNFRRLMRRVQGMAELQPIDTLNKSEANGADATDNSRKNQVGCTPALWLWLRCLWATYFSSIII
jgi:hypothetical protein